MTVPIYEIHSPYPVEPLPGSVFEKGMNRRSPRNRNGIDKQGLHTDGAHQQRFSNGGNR
jgi:hypothetical protein